MTQRSESASRYVYRFLRFDYLLYACYAVSCPFVLAFKYDPSYLLNGR